MKTVKKCPFCGADEGMLAISERLEFKFIHCCRCGASGPLSWTDRPEECWNRRVLNDA